MWTDSPTSRNIDSDSRKVSAEHKMSQSRGVPSYSEWVKKEEEREKKGKRCQYLLRNVFYPADPRGTTDREVYRDFQPSLTSSAGPALRIDQTTGSVHSQPTLPNR